MHLMRGETFCVLGPKASVPVLFSLEQCLQHCAPKELKEIQCKNCISDFFFLILCSADHISIISVLKERLVSVQMQTHSIRQLSIV